MSVYGGAKGLNLMSCRAVTHRAEATEIDLSLFLYSVGDETYQTTRNTTRENLKNPIFSKKKSKRGKENIIMKLSWLLLGVSSKKSMQFFKKLRNFRI